MKKPDLPFPELLYESMMFNREPTTENTLILIKFLYKQYTAQQSVQLTALRRGLAVSWVIIIVLLAVVAFTIGGN